MKEVNILEFDKVQKLIVSYDYAIFNNGIESLISNNHYRSMFDYIDELMKISTEISLKIALIIKESIITVLDMRQLLPLLSVSNDQIVNEYRTLSDRLLVLYNEYLEFSPALLSLVGLERNCVDYSVSYNNLK